MHNGRDAGMIGTDAIICCISLHQYKLSRDDEKLGHRHDLRVTMKGALGKGPRALGRRTLDPAVSHGRRGLDEAASPRDGGSGLGGFCEVGGG
jgi:hypothetical protein